jgi:hypothetical protein
LRLKTQLRVETASVGHQAGWDRRRTCLVLQVEPLFRAELARDLAGDLAQAYSVPRGDIHWTGNLAIDEAGEGPPGVLDVH